MSNKMPSPSCWTAEITGSIVLQSSQNCTALISRHSFTIGPRWGLVFNYPRLNMWRICLALDREGHKSRKCSSDPLCQSGVLQHSGRVQRPSLFPGTQWPVRASTLNLPERSLAWVVPFSTSQGEEPQDLKMGWHLDRPRYLVLRYWRELRVSALVLSWSSQYSVTAALTLDLTSCLEGLLLSQLKVPVGGGYRVIYSSHV